jgi:hypothetical protein
MPCGARAPIPGVARQQGMTNCARSLAAALTVLAAASLAACSSGPSYAHPWCAPLIAQFHAHETRQAYLNGLAATGRQGAPVGKLIADETAYTEDQATANAPGTAGFGAVASAPADLAKVSGDLKQLNSECGQAADAYKSDNA